MVTSHTRAGTKLGYQPSLDGLRAISVAAVLLYHMDLAWIPGGFLGVEVFFVVSGFLITALLVEERHHTGSVSLRGFWTRRARRLLPALYVLLLVVPAVTLVFYRDAAGRLGGDVLAALFYVSNWWQIFLDESYFAQAGRPPVLRHLWSLAVEEQFYILFPALFVWLLARAGRDGTRNVLVAVALGSAVWMAVLYEPSTDPSRVYYGTDTRLSGLLLGAMLAVVWTPWRSRGTASKAAGPVLNAAGIGSMLLLAWFFARVNEFDPFVYRGGFLLLDLVCVVLIAVLVHPSASLSKVLALPPLVWIGVRSYSIYLWHWPIFMFTRPELDVALTGWPLFALRVGLTLAAAELSYRFVEQPVRHGALGRLKERWQAPDEGERARFHQWLLVRVGALGVVVLLVAVGLVVASSSPDRERMELEAAGAIGLDGLDAEGLVDTTTTTAVAPTSTSPRDGSDDPATTTSVAGTDSTTSTTAGADPTVTSTNAVAVGDSVMLGASGAMQQVMPGIRVDAKVSRQFDDLADAATWYATSGNMPGPAVVQVGNNGVATEERIETMVDSLGDRLVVLVNAKVERPWEAISNERTARVAERHDNVVLVDWYSMASSHPDWFVADGTHLRPEGQLAFARAIAEVL
ncbi:MAG: acyltransferase [Microthrixaceae bacterium]|nr:acyltransferase [Microthrixaceae bacterium]